MWPKNQIKTFLEKAKCYANQYSKFKHGKVNVSVNTFYFTKHHRISYDKLKVEENQLFHINTIIIYSN